MHHDGTAITRIASAALRRIVRSSAACAEQGAFLQPYSALCQTPARPAQALQRPGIGVTASSTWDVGRQRRVASRLETAANATLGAAVSIVAAAAKRMWAPSAMEALQATSVSGAKPGGPVRDDDDAPAAVVAATAIVQAGDNNDTSCNTSSSGGGGAGSGEPAAKRVRVDTGNEVTVAVAPAAPAVDAPAPVEGSIAALAGALYCAAACACAMACRAGRVGLGTLLQSATVCRCACCNMQALVLVSLRQVAQRALLHQILACCARPQPVVSALMVNRAADAKDAHRSTAAVPPAGAAVAAATLTLLAIALAEHATIALYK